jgi:hypothetical protein
MINKNFEQIAVLSFGLFVIISIVIIGALIFIDITVSTAIFIMLIYLFYIAIYIGVMMFVALWLDIRNKK